MLKVKKGSDELIVLNSSNNMTHGKFNEIRMTDRCDLTDKPFWKRSTVRMYEQMVFVDE